MIALDTNVLVRFLVRDNESQSARAARTIQRAIAGDEQLFVSDLVVCELVWALISAYRVSRAEIAENVEKLLRAEQLKFSSRELLSRALDHFVKGHGDYADYVVREHAHAAGCTRVVTFDRVLLNEQGFSEP